MAEVVKMPKLSDTMEEGVLAKWHKKEGEQVSSGDLLAEIETDKATMDFESFQDGVLLYVGVGEGEAVPVDSVIAVIGEKGEDFKALLEEASASAPAKAEEKDEEKAEKSEAPEKDEAAPSSAPAEKAPASTSSSDGRLKASPLAKKMAEDKGIDISKVSGSGDNGRIVKSDIENFKGSAGTMLSPSIVGEESFEDVPVTQMRKTISRRLAESKFSAPHFYLNISLRMEKAMEARKAMNANGDVKISYNDMVVKAVALSLKKHPAINSSWLGDKIRYNHHVHIGVAVAVEDGLLVPVIRFADGKPLSHINAEVKDLAGKAKDKKLQPSDWEGNTFTISNLGMFGIDDFTAIVNPPDACILAVGGISNVPVVEDGEVIPGHVMKVTLSCDHRVVDGASGAEFLQTFKGFMENPVTMLV
ncbi:MAG: pyruvate dehydrogenase E2 component (dihydrolipoamide acetyltransferase) [Sphingobacteriales bacterium]|jgi:pyruvate dehydrogenase E2 component (dihydrolipoamide acetyltransferase)